MRFFYSRLLITLLFVFGTISVNAQVNISGSTGANGSYTTLKTAFDAINANVVQTGNPIVISITGNTTEISTAALNAGDWATVTISPTGGATRTISGAIAGPLIDLNGADNVTINGLNTGGNTLTISNTATGASSTVRFIADASNNIIQNCTLTGSTTSFGVVYFSTGTTTGNDGNSINQCNITAAGSNFPLMGIYSLGTSAVIDNSGNTINANNISDYFNAVSTTAGISISSNNTAWTITNNRLFQTATRIYTLAATHYGIILNGNGDMVSGNILGFSNSSGTGTTNMVGNSVPLSGTFPNAYSVTGTPVAIAYVGIGCIPTNINGPVSNIQGNTISGFALFTGGSTNNKNGVWCGIFIQFGTVNIGTTTGNNIGAISGTGSVYIACTSTGAAVVGIYSTSNNAVIIQNNTIGAIDAMGTSASVCGSITGINAGTIGDPAGYKIGNSTISGNTIGNAGNPNLRMGNLTTGGNLSNTGTTFSASSGGSIFSGIINFQTSAIVIGTLAMPNLIRNVYQNSTSSSAFARGIYNYAGSSVTISNNNITEIISNSTYPNGIQPTAVSGIMTESNALAQTIELNNISGLRALNTGVNDVNVIGIIIINTTATGNVRSNKIYDLTNSSTGTLPQIIGLYVAGSSNSQGWTFSNNMISLTNGGNTNPVQITGIYNIGVSPALLAKYYFNSVNIGGSASSGVLGSVAFWRTGTATNNHRNNIYTNTRTGGTAIHHTILCSSSTPATGWSSTASDYNVFNNAGPIIGRWGTIDVDLAGWQSNSLGDNNSKSGIPLNFVNAATGDLHLVATSNCSIDGAGTPVAGITTDYDAQTRDVTTPDIGADEFTSTYSGMLAGMAGVGVCENKTVSVSGTIYTTGNCNLIAKVLPSGADPIAGKVNVCVTLDAVQQVFNGEPYVQRHFDLEPTTSNITTTSATITLYFTDVEFMAYNTNNPLWPALPTVAGGANSDPKRANLKVTQFHGTATSSPTAPGFYTGVRVLIIPLVTNIFWNGAYWEVTFNITGFSGFYVHTNIFNTPLPITVNYFSGTKQNHDHLLNWKVTCNSMPSATMELQRSGDGRNYTGIYNLTATAFRCLLPFDYTDAQPTAGINYYRLKITDANGKITYSTIVSLLNADKGFDIMNIAPNPIINGNFKLNISAAQKTQMEIVITDIQGRLMQKQKVNMIAGFNSIPINVTNFANGTYQVSGNTADGRSRVLRFVIQ